MREILLIQVSGNDRPGLTAAFTRILGRFGLNILDIGQAVIHDSLSLGILVETPPDRDSSAVIKEMLFEAHKLNVSVRFRPIDHDNYEEWVREQGKDRFLITLLAHKITAEQIGDVTRVIADNELNIDSINRLSGRVHLDGQTGEGSARACVEVSVRGQPSDANAMHAAFLDIANKRNLDIAFQRDSVFRRNRRLVAFDMDSTLIESEVIDELAVEAGVGEQVAAITKSAMRGEIDFDESFRQRVAQLEALDEKALERVWQRIRVTEGAERLINTLKAIGYKTAILSGGFTWFGEHLQRELGIDYVYANDLEIQDGRVTGRVAGPIVNGERKARLLRDIAAREEISLEQVVAVGDGANDLPMLDLAGLGIAFRAKPTVQENAEQAISTLGLDGILYLIGVRDEDQTELRSSGHA